MEVSNSRREQIAAPSPPWDLRRVSVKEIARGVEAETIDMATAIDELRRRGDRLDLNHGQNGHEPTRPDLRAEVQRLRAEAESLVTRAKVIASLLLEGPRR
jgi:hypothetical protein